MPEKLFDFLAKERLLDNLKAQRDPVPEVADVLADILRDEDYARYFFKDLDNDAWLLPLSQRGVFDRPPSAVPHDGGWRFPQWPAARYLQRIAVKRPSEVAPILQRIETDNPMTCSELVEALYAMPPATAAKVVPAVLRWLELPIDFLLSERVIGLIRHLAKGKQWRPSLRLLNALMEPDIPELKDASEYFRPEARSRREPYVLEQLLKDIGNLFPGDALVHVLPAFERQLKMALRLEEQASSRKRYSDFSSGWRPAIEQHEQNWTENYKGMLVSALRDVLERLPDSSQQLADTLRGYARSRRSIFRRLSLHRARVGERGLRQFRRELLMNPRFDSDLDCHHELYLLRSDCIGDLSETERNLLINRLTVPPKRRKGESVADLQLRSRAKLVQELSGIERWLPADLKQRYDQIVKEQGEREHPDFLLYHSGGWVSMTSPRGVDELTQMSTEDIVQFLQVWTPEQRGRLSEESRLGLARELQSAVRKDPQRFLGRLDLFGTPGLHGIYVQHLFDGIREAVKDGSPIGWESVIAFGEELLATDLRRYDYSGDPENESRGSLVASALASLFEEGYKAEQDAPQSNLWDRTERILEILARDPDPDAAHEATYGGTNMDPLTLSLNTARGRAMHAVFSFARHEALAETQGQDQASAQPSDRRLRPRIRSLLESKLDKTVDPSEAVHSVFGVYLPLLLYADRQWTLEMLPRIFPSSPKYWWAAFESHIMYGQFQAPIYRLLQTEYRRGIEEAQTTRPERSRIATFEEQLGKHLALVFWHGLEDFKDPASNLALFFEGSSDGARSSFVWLIWRALQEVKPDVNSDYWRRCRTLWEHRVAAARASDSVEPFQREMGSYAWWLGETPEDVRSMRTLILGIIPYLERWAHAGDITEYLDRQVEVSPSVVTEILRELVKSGRELYIASEHRDRIKRILRTALTSGESDSEANALAIINHYERTGDYGYGDLVE